MATAVGEDRGKVLFNKNLLTVRTSAGIGDTRIRSVHMKLPVIVCTCVRVYMHRCAAVCLCMCARACARETAEERGTPIFMQAHIYRVLLFFLRERISASILMGCAAIRTGILNLGFFSAE